MKNAAFYILAAIVGYAFAAFVCWLGAHQADFCHDEGEYHEPIEHCSLP